MLYRYRFSIKKPKGDRKTFTIFCDKKNAEDRVQKSISKFKEFASETVALDNINDQFVSGKIDRAAALVLVEQIVKGLKTRVNTFKDAQAQVIISDNNLQLFNEFWNDVYSDRRLKDRQRTYNTFLYTLRTLEPHSLLGTDKETLRRHFDKKLKGNAHRRYTVYLNMLLTYFKRDFTLSVDKAPSVQINFIDIDDFRKVIQKCTDEKLKLLIATLFCTGCRTGEAFALNKTSIKSDQAVFISHQIDRNLIRREIKNDRPHEAIVITEFLDELKKWCSLSQQEKNEIRHTCAHDIPNFFRSQSFNITAHELRHSYVNFLAGRGLSLDDIADCLGDTHAVVEKHYRGWIMGNKRISHLSELVNSENNKLKLVR